METQNTGAELNPGVVLLEQPISRGEQVIGMLALRKPKAGELRGLSLSDLLNCDVSAIIKVLPRVSSPPITEAEADDMDPADLTACGSEIVGFLLPKGVRAAFQPT
ncbi:phage tail assembly protein [Phenylobacterium sp.]|uniref:phage tail assembly protein n=1 Tax=Phenylobacterium sp. TaxID=1871053 RepID=UPI00301D1E64